MRVTFTSVTALVIFFSILFTGCQREISPEFDDNAPPPNGTTIWKTAGVTGQVVDAGGIPIGGAEVKFGTSVIQTNKNGYFSFANASFSSAETFVIVKKAGYITGSRTFYPRQESNNYVKIQLLPNCVAGTVQGELGGIVELRNGFTVELPAEAVVTASGSVYMGLVDVVAAYLDPTANDVNDKMPGDLRGVTTGGQQRILKSYGMVAVELSTQSGQPLKVKAGAKAKLTFPVPASLTGSAPATLPLWYFDETNGLWKEEGSAQLQGDSYVGEVNHFTFWNVDLPSQFVKLSMKIVSPSGNPVAGAKVVIRSVTSGTSAYDYTDNTGYVTGGVPKGEELEMEAFDNCTNSVLTKNLGTLNVDTDLGNQQISGNISLQTVYGTVNRCNGTPLANGTIQVLLNNTQSAFAVVENGGFSITFLTCAGTASAQLVAIDNNGQQQGNPVNVQLSTNNVNAGLLQACGVSINTFINLMINNVPEVWNNNNSNIVEGSEDFTFLFPNGEHYMDIAGGDTSREINGSTLFDGVTFSFPIPPTVSGYPLSVPIDYFSVQDSSYYNEYTPLNPNLTATITANGAVGQFIEGSFSGQFIGVFSNDTVSINCTFRVKKMAW